MARWISLIIVLLALAQPGVSQDRYLAYLIDKEGSPFTMDAPEEFLSERALNRRQKAGIGIDVKDLPVSSQYIMELEQSGVEVRLQSKWLNAVLVEIDQADSMRIADLDFIISVERVADGERFGSAGGRKNGGVSSGRTNPQENIAYSWHGIDKLHENRKFGAGIRIAVMDASFTNADRLPQFTHLFSENRVIMTENLVNGTNNVFEGPIDHGTLILSVLAGEEEGTYSGIAPDSEYLLFETEDATSEYRVEEFNWTVAAEKADSAGADVINTSLGYSYLFSDPAMDYSYSDMDGKTTMISRAAQKAVATGMLVVVSAGNEGDSNWRHITAPADVDGVLSVGALGSDETLAIFSSRGPSWDGRIKPDVVTLGRQVPAFGSTGEISYRSGTSLASPIIAGYAALLLEQFPSLTGKEAFDLIRNSGDREASPDNDFGYGVPFTDIVLSNIPVADDVYIFPNPARSYLSWNLSEAFSHIQVMDMKGRLVLDEIGIENRLDVSRLQRGIYIIRFLSPGSVKQFRFVKE